MDQRRVDTDALNIGDTIMLTVDGRTTAMTVWRFDPAGSGGRRYSDGRVVYAHIRPGGYGITFDRGSHHYPNVALPAWRLDSTD